MKLLVATFVLVFLRALQQQNVIHGHYVWAVFTAYGIAIGEVAVVLWVVYTGWAAIAWTGTGGALGVVAAMWMHRRLRRGRC